MRTSCGFHEDIEGEGPDKIKPNIEDYATIEAYVGDVPVYAFGYTYIYGVSPDLLPGVVMQEENSNEIVKFKPKKSWEITNNLCGSTPAREPKSMWRDDQPLLPIHLIDGDPETAWSSRGGTAPDRQPEWIRIDLPAENMVASVALVCSKVGPSPGGNLKVGKALPGDLMIKLSRDAKQWEIVYDNRHFSGPDAGPTVIEFAPRPAKQIWLIATNLPQKVGFWGHSFSLGEVEIRAPGGNNLALISRGAGVQVSSTHYGYGMDRFTQDMLWPIQYDLGFKWTRVGYDMGMYLWSYVEREKENLRIDPKADTAITEAHNNAIKVILCLDKGNWLYHDPPRKVDWKKARTQEMMETYYDHQGWPHQSAEMMSGWLRYVDYMVRHFKGRVTYYEICNEWQGIGRENYLKIVRATIPVIKNADADARIMLGSTGGFDRQVILSCLKAENGLGKQLDAIGWHPFYQTDPDSPAYRSYREDVEQFKKECATLGFKGQYAATEWTWAAPYPGSADWCSEMQKAKYSAQLMTTHCGLDIISLYNETFQTGRIDWDCNLLRNAFSVDPISPAQPQPVYYVLRSISTVLDGFRAADFPVRFSGEKKFDCYAFKRDLNGMKGQEVIIAAWIPGKTKDGIVAAKSDVILLGAQARQAWVLDIFNGTEQELNITRNGNNTVIKGMLVKDYPVFVRVSVYDNE
ncbi:discoidin domain-containing protein [Candidatus Poribacteria bacterium]|nr:discoidin domain-containing protein [Candidatus Poribacteria bacterium]